MVSAKKDLTTAIQDHNRPTYILLNSAFPGGVPEPFYLPLLFVLYEEMSNRSISRVISFVTDKEYSEVYNDIPIVSGYVEGQEQPSKEFLEKVTKVETHS